MPNYIEDSKKIFEEIKDEINKYVSDYDVEKAILLIAVGLKEYISKNIKKTNILKADFYIMINKQPFHLNANFDNTFNYISLNYVKYAKEPNFGLMLYFLIYPKVKKFYDFINNPRSFIGKRFKVTIDRPVGYDHNGTIYELNYGFVNNTVSYDLEDLDCYILEEKEPLTKYEGKVVAIINRLNDVESKLVISNRNKKYTKEEIIKLTHFQEQYFDIKVII